MLLAVLGFSSLALLIGGLWAENFVLRRISLEIERSRWQGWKSFLKAFWAPFFTPTRKIVRRYEVVNGYSAWSRAYRIANAGMLVGFCGIVALTVMFCIDATQ
jgi:hypothetical protein